MQNFMKQNETSISAPENGAISKVFNMSMRALCFFSQGRACGYQKKKSMTKNTREHAHSGYTEFERMILHARYAACDMNINFVNRDTKDVNSQRNVVHDTKQACSVQRHQKAGGPFSILATSCSS